jgi:hypothetical protein
MRLITSTAPVVLDSLKSVGEEDNQPEPLQALINKLNEAIAEGDAQTQPQPRPPAMAAATVQTTNPNMKFF